jgi:hypothetical protein
MTGIRDRLDPCARDPSNEVRTVRRREEGIPLALQYERGTPYRPQPRRNGFGSEYGVQVARDTLWAVGTADRRPRHLLEFDLGLTEHRAARQAQQLQQIANGLALLRRPGAATRLGGGSGNDSAPLVLKSRVIDRTACGWASARACATCPPIE